jgi:hypothetical protein
MRLRARRDFFCLRVRGKHFYFLLFYADQVSANAYRPHGLPVFRPSG